MKTEETNLIIRFANDKAAKQFAHWLCGSGEQMYWEWMECREQEEDGDITATHFDYHNQDETKAIDDPARYEPFVADNIIRTKTGRLDRKGGF